MSSWLYYAGMELANRRFELFSSGELRWWRMLRLNEPLTGLSSCRGKARVLEDDLRDLFHLFIFRDQHVA